MSPQPPTAFPLDFLLRHEDPDAFLALHASLIEELSPFGAVAEQLVHRLAIAYWKQRRGDRIEVAIHQKDGPADLPRLRALAAYQADLSREVVSLRKMLADLRKQQARRPRRILSPEERRSRLRVVSSVP